VDPAFKGLYFFEASWYFSGMISLFVDAKKKDFFQMLPHHVFTVLLLMISFHDSHMRVGAVVFVLHNISDPFLQMAKLFKYLFDASSKKKTLFDVISTIAFVCFMIAFFATRLVFSTGDLQLPLPWSELLLRPVAQPDGKVPHWAADCTAAHPPVLVLPYRKGGHQGGQGEQRRGHAQRLGRGGRGAAHQDQEDAVRRDARAKQTPGLRFPVSFRSGFRNASIARQRRTRSSITLYRSLTIKQEEKGKTNRGM